MNRISSTFFVGRDRELQDAARVLQRARGGSGALALITGEAGVGKTELAAQVVELARADGFGVAWSVCSGSGSGTGFGAWRDLLRQLSATLPAARVAVAALVDIAALLAPVTHLHEAHQISATDRHALLESVVELLRIATRDQPIVLVFDDLPGADASSVAMLHHVVAQLRTLPLVIVATCRDPGAGSAVHKQPSIGVLFRFAHVLPLLPLHGAELAALIEELTAAAPSDEFLAAVVARTGGNPLFATETVRLLAQTGDLNAEATAELLPASARAIARELRADLSDRCRELIDVASVAGTSFAVDLVAAAVELEPDDVATVLQDAVNAGVLRRLTAQTGVFRHEVIRDSIHDAIDIARRAELHERIGSVLAARAEGGDDIDPAAIAAHLLAGGANAKGAARTYAIVAGDRAMALRAYESAAGHYELALAAGDSPAASAEVELRLGDALTALGDRAGGRAHFLAVAALARRSGRPDLLAEAALGLGAGAPGFEISLVDREQVDLLEEALRSLDARHAAARAAVLARLTVATTSSASEADRLARSDESIVLARESGDPAVLAAVLAARCDVLAGPDHCETRRAMATEVITLASALDDRGLELLGHRHRLVAALELGDIVAADDEVRVFDRTARVLRQPLYGWYVPLWHGMRALMEGRLDACAQWCGEAAAIGAAAQSDNAAELTMTLRWCLLSTSRRRTEMSALVDQLDADAGSGVWVWVVHALDAAETGRLDDARSRLDAIAPRLALAPRDSEWLPMLTQLSEAIALIGGHDVAAWTYDALTPYASLFVVEGIGAALRGSVERPLGLLAAALGRVGDARAHFDRAVEADRSIGAALLVARTLWDAALCLGDAQGLDVAREALRALGVPDPSTAGDSVPSSSATSTRAWHRDGEVWTLAFEGHEVRVRDSKGLRDIARLLAQPSQPIPALDLAAPPSAPRSSHTAAAGLRAAGDLGPVIDERARQAYRKRLAELAEEIDDADERGDARGSERAHAEHDMLVEQLAQAYGLGGRARRAGSDAERARTTVTARIRDAIRKIEAVHPPLGRHLRRFVQTGTVCVYEPDLPVPWQL